MGSLYRPPNNPTKEFLDNYTELLNELNKERNELILRMDHNLDLLKINQHKLTEEFLECNLDGGMILQITKPTRITQTSAILIDNVMISKKLSRQTKSRILVENISDHLPSLVSIKNFGYMHKEGTKIYSRNICKNNLDKLRGALQGKN